MLRLSALSVRAIAALALWLAAAAASADSHLSADPVVMEARAAVEAGAFDAALDLLRPLDPAGRADRIDVLFLTGIAAVGAAEAREDEDAREDLLDEAIQAFRAILVDSPDLVRVRLELARAFFLKEDDDLARGHFERVLAGGVRPEVAATVQGFLAVIRARKRWTAYVGGALAPDSNIGAASDEEEVQIQTVFGELPFRRSKDDIASSGIGVSVWGGGEYQYPLADRVRLRAGADFSRREYPRSRFDQDFVAAHVGPRWIIGRDLEASVLATAHYRRLGDLPYNHALGGRVEAEYLVSPRLRAHARASWQRQSHRDTLDYLDGPLTSFSIGGFWVATPTLAVRSDVGYGTERPSLDRLRNSTRWGRVDVTVALPRGFTVGVGGEYHARRYDGIGVPSPLLGPPGDADRADNTRVARISAYNRAFTLFGFSPQAVAVYEARDSNAKVQDYRRARLELRFQRLF